MIKLATFLPYRIATLSSKLSNSFAEVYSDKYQLTVPQWRVIAHLAEKSTLTAKEICIEAGLDKSTTSRAVKQLLDQEIIIGRQAETDKRATELTLTEKGNTLYQELSNDAAKWQESLFESFSSEEQTMLFSILQKLDENSN
ncbi:MarR family winged helix-turn-helix transcriptional regulator [Pseudoalteromonas sp. SSM20]|uniref:MarR family winged helix-turn-helix transcriptional regulator n=1 Tax=Pseudoalteromonas sp. SSM20 TaxID=3139394 RepID=UPI003BAD8E3B